MGRRPLPVIAGWLGAGWLGAGWLGAGWLGAGVPALTLSVRNGD